MKFVTLILLIIALAIPASASSVVSWTQEDITGYNLTLNYTSEFNVAKDDILGISIINIGNKSENDTITINKINVSDTTKATGSQEGSWVIGPGSNQTIDFILNMTTNDAVDLDIKIHYNVSSENKTLSVTAKYPGAPKITPWNNKTNSNATTLTVNISEFVRFNATPNQLINSWNWYKDDEKQKQKQSPTLDHFNTSWNDAGAKTIKVNATNANGTTQTILWKVTVKGTDEREENDHNKISADIINWSPQVVDYIYVNDTISETIKYSITTTEPLTNVNWTEDGNVVYSDNIDNTYNYSRTWDDGDLGFHTIAFKGTNNADNEVEFRWYVNVYEINGVRGGNWFDVIDYSNVKVKMFKYKRAKYGSNSENTLNFVNRLHDSIATRQMTREALRDAFKSRELSVSEYVAALKQIQSDIKDELKIAKRMKNIEKGIEKEDEEENQDKNYQSDRVKQNVVNKQDSKEEKKKDSSVASNSNGNKKGNYNNGNNGKNRKDD